MKTFKMFLLGCTAMLCLAASALAAEKVAVKESVSPDYGPEGRKFGAGIILGDPTGFTAKGFLSPKMAIDAMASWSFTEEAFLIIGDLTYEFAQIPVRSSSLTLPFYAGAGGKIGFDRGGRNNGRTVGGIRIPLGIAAQFTHQPIEVFVEVAPGMEVAPSTTTDVTGGVGARFYF